MRHRFYFSPGMFGFGRLATFDYFAHLERALGERIRAAGDEMESVVVDVPPTASMRRRAGRLAEIVAHTCGAEAGETGPIHLVGHSTGGLDARILASPGVVLPVPAQTVAWLPRLCSVTTMNTPHFGTPLAKFFATVSGQRVLYAISALTFIGLSLGAPPLAAASAIVVALGRLDRAIGLEIGPLDRATDAIIRLLDDARGRELRAYLEAVKLDQGAILQLTPEAMELFHAGIHDRDGVLYQSTVSMAPPPTVRRTLRSSIAGPWGATSAAIFAALYGFTSQLDERYPCAVPYAGDAAEALLARTYGRAPGARANDGVVPLRSQVWGELAWAGYADHLDVLGHFRDARRRARPKPGQTSTQHTDWLASGAEFDRARFGELADAIAGGALRAAARRSR